MRLIFLLLALVCVAAGVLFGALNPQPVEVDFYWFRIDAALGATFLVSALIGVVLGGIAMQLGVVWPLRRRLKRARRELLTTSSSTALTDPREPREPLDAETR
jgi:uncharacterized integral membrane protein